MHCRLNTGTEGQESTRWWTKTRAGEGVAVSTSEPLTEYLAQVCHHLTGLSEGEASAVLDEVEQHLLASVQARVELGETPEAAWQNAVVAFGSPESVGRALTTTYQTTGVGRRPLNWAEIRRALSVLVPLNLIANGLLLATSWVALGKRNDGFWNSAVLVLFVIATVVVPIFAGARIGSRSVSRRPGADTLIALTLLIAATLPFQLLVAFARGGVVGGPFGLLLGFTALYAYWLLPACATAHLVGRSAYRRRHNLLLTR